LYLKFISVLPIKIVVVMMKYEGDQMKDIEVIRACGSMEKTRNACSILVVKPERKV
jgi:hypothetical protein